MMFAIESTVVPAPVRSCVDEPDVLQVGTTAIEPEPVHQSHGHPACG